MTVARVLAGLALLAAAASACTAAAQERRLRDWRPVPAVVVVSGESTSSTRGRTDRHVYVRYRYFVEDGAHESHRLYPGPWATTAGDAASLLARFPAGTATTAYVDPADPRRAFLVPERSFLPYLLALLVVAPLGALAAGIATGGVRVVRSGEREHSIPKDVGGGFFTVPAFRPYLALCNSAAAALVVFALVGGIARVDYFARTRDPGGAAVFASVAWIALLARLFWAVVKRSWVGLRMGDARLAMRPRYPRAGAPLHVVFDQPVRTGVFVRAVDLTLVAERLTIRRARGRTRAKKVRVACERIRLPVNGSASPGTPIHVEGTIEVPADAVAGDGFLSWHVEARTRVLGPDYVTRFHFSAPDEGDD